MEKDKLFASLEARHGLPNGLLNAVMMQESRGNANALSPKGAQGYFQFMPATAKQYNVNPSDLTSSATGAARMYADLLKQNNGDLNKALAGYNWGQGNLSRKGLDKAPKETRDYIVKVKQGMGGSGSMGGGGEMATSNNAEQKPWEYYAEVDKEQPKPEVAQGEQNPWEYYAEVEKEQPKENGLWTKLKAIDTVAKGINNFSPPLGIAAYVDKKGNELQRKTADSLADTVFEKTNSPLLATATKMSPDILNLIAGYGLAGIKTPISAKGALSQAAERVGYTPNLAQRTNSPDLKNAYDTLSNMPGSARVIGTHEAKNAEAINSAVAKAIGQKTNRITGDVLANANDELGAVRNSLRSNVNIPQGEQNILSSIDDATVQLKKSLRNTGQFKGDMERIKQGVQSGSITGEQYQIWRTDLRDAADTAFKAGKSQLGNAYKSVLNSIDDAARGSASPEWLLNDKQFSVLNTVQKGNIINPVTGDVSPSLLTNQFYRDFGNFAKQGKLPGEINDIATITRGYPMLKEGSQTARREAYNSVFPWLMSPINYGAAKILTSNPANATRLIPYAIPARSSIGGLLDLLKTEYQPE